ncbi:MAG TPA: hypothetical protein GX505_00305 [Clostridiales bacterium]|nr:hypothetical protein [Clostridiales bacterium]
MMNRINQNASPALTFLFSIVPGAGHMYLGLMRRGLELMAAFFACIFIVADLLHLAEIGVPLCIIIFFYSLFDAQHLNKAIRRGETISDTGQQFFPKIALNAYHMGIAAIVLGLIFLMDRLRSYIIHFIPDIAYSMIERSIVPLLIIALGLYIIKNASREKENPVNKE